MKVAIVHDDFIQDGGAETLVLAILEMFPNSSLYSSYFTQEWIRKINDTYPNVSIKYTFMQKLPLVKYLYKLYAPLYPFAIESMSLDEYDVVISSSSRFGHGVITKPETKHFSYVNTPGRMFWNEFSYFGKKPNFVIRIILHILRQWDFVASNRPDVIIANSLTVQKRIYKYWNKDSTVIHPFVSYPLSDTSYLKKKRSTYYLIVSRLTPWKRVDIAIEAAKRRKTKLVIVGKGKDYERLNSISDKRYVEFKGWISQAELLELYRNCRGVIMTQEEDFGMVSVEAQSQGTPVIAYNKGGASETVINKITGLLFEHQTADCLSSAIEVFEGMTFLENECILNAYRFSRDRFQISLKKLINKYV